METYLGNVLPASLAIFDSVGGPEPRIAGVGDSAITPFLELSDGSNLAERWRYTSGMYSRRR